MPHKRPRFIQKKLERKLKFSPVIAIQGARQTGKSFLARELLAPQLKDSKYISLDQSSQLKLANTDIETFLARWEDHHPIIIDEAQKAPDVFHQVKFLVDQNRTPGKYILLGSTEFSKFSQIRENLTGRMTRLRVFPLTVRESLLLPSKNTENEPFFLSPPEPVGSTSPKRSVSRSTLLRHLSRGGLPAAFAVRSAEESTQYIEDWLELTLLRDIHQFSQFSFSSDLCRDILSCLALEDEPSAGTLSRKLKVDLRKIQSHLRCLAELFVVTPLQPFRESSGKPLYYLFDVGIASYLGASLQRQLETLFLQEYSAKQSFYASHPLMRNLFYFRTTKGSRLSFVEEDNNQIRGILLLDAPTTDKRRTYILETFGRRFPGSTLHVLSPTEALPFPRSIRIHLWESLA